MLGAGSASAARDGGVGASGPSACDDDCSLLNEDEEFEEEGEEYDDEQDLRPRALPVDGEPDFDSVCLRTRPGVIAAPYGSHAAAGWCAQGPPADGLEYLRRVRWEAERCPSVMRADIDPRQFDRSALVRPTRVCACPSLRADEPPRRPLARGACVQQAHELRAASRRLRAGAAGHEGAGMTLPLACSAQDTQADAAVPLRPASRGRGSSSRSSPRCARCVRPPSGATTCSLFVASYAPRCLL